MTISARKKKPIDVLLPEEDVKAGAANVDIELKPFQFRDTGKVVRVLTNMASAIVPFIYNFSGFFAHEDNEVVIQTEGLDAFVAIFDEHTEDFAQLLSFFSDKDKEFFLSADYDVVLEFAMQVLERNIDFFMKRLAPIVKTLIQAIAAKKQTGTK